MVRNSLRGGLALLLVVLSVLLVPAVVAQRGEATQDIPIEFTGIVEAVTPDTLTVASIVVDVRNAEMEVQPALGGTVKVEGVLGSGGSVIATEVKILAPATSPITNQDHEAEATAEPTSPESECSLGPGYWQNHPNDWPLVSIQLGNQTYERIEALTLLFTDAQSDASLILARQLIATQLNLANGSDPTPINNTVAEANTLLTGFADTLPYQVDPASVLGQAMVSLADLLDAYNNNQIVPGCETTNEADVQPITIEGTVEAVNGDTLIVSNLTVQPDPSTPVFPDVHVNDTVRIEGVFEETETGIVLIAATIEILNEAEGRGNDGQGNASGEDAECAQQPPAWADAEGWRRRCEEQGNG